MHKTRESIDKQQKSQYVIKDNINKHLKIMELKIEKSRVLSAAKKCSDAKKVLKELFPEIFEKDWKDIKTFEDACDTLGISNNSCRPIFDEEESADEIAYKKLKVIVMAINQGWTPDWNDTDQRKWFPYFKMSSGFGFSISYYYYGYSRTLVGSRLCFESEGKANYAGNQFINLYKDFLTTNQ